MFSWKNTLLTKNLPGSLKKNIRCKSNSFSVCLQLLVPRSMLNAMMEAMACPAWEMAPDECPSIGDGAFFEGCSPCCLSFSGGELSFSHRSLSTLFHFVRILSANPPMCATCFFARNLSLCSQALNKLMESLPVDVG